MAPKLRIGTRASKLALWQAHYVRDALMAAHAGLEVELVEIVTKGDRITDRPLNQVGGQGLFVKGIQEQLLGGKVDLAVHSMKDLPGAQAEGLVLAATPKRADPRDAVVGRPLADLPAGARVGTSSLRRGALVRRIRPDLEVVSIRGNVPTRVGKVDSGEVDAAILASAGLDRLGLSERIAERLDPERFLPAAAQGILALETRAEDARAIELVSVLSDSQTSLMAQTERAFLQTLRGGCQVPMACHARLEGDEVHCSGFVCEPDGSAFYEASASAPFDEAAQLGADVASMVLATDAARILERLGVV